MQHICGYRTFPTVIANGIPYIPMGTITANCYGYGLRVELIICENPLV